MHHEDIGIYNLASSRSLDHEVASVSNDASRTTDVRGVDTDANRQRKNRFKKEINLLGGDQWGRLRVCSVYFLKDFIIVYTYMLE
jgi:hypothetical protein